MEMNNWKKRKGVCFPILVPKKEEGSYTFLMKKQNCTF